MKRLIPLALAALLLAGCGASTAETTNDTGGLGHITTHTITLPDGSQVLCAVYKNSYAGGLSCDWDGATP